LEPVQNQTYAERERVRVFVNEPDPDLVGTRYQQHRQDLRLAEERLKIIRSIAQQRARDAEKDRSIRLGNQPPEIIVEEPDPAMARLAQISTIPVGRAEVALQRRDPTDRRWHSVVGAEATQTIDGIRAHAVYHTPITNEDGSRTDFARLSEPIMTGPQLNVKIPLIGEQIQLPPDTVSLAQYCSSPYHSIVVRLINRAQQPITDRPNTRSIR
jgi:hypothetical protein